MFLDDDELIELTQRRRRDAQIRMLRAMGIEHRVRADGSVAVHKTHVEQLFGVTVPTPRRKAQNIEPDWSRL